MKSPLFILLAFFGLVGVAQATNLNEPPFYSQVRECIRSAQQNLPPEFRDKAAFYESTCARSVCGLHKTCCEYYCANKVSNNASYASCLSSCAPSPNNP